jgi:hypothetical protein
MVRNLVPKFADGNGGDYCFRRIWPRKFLYVLDAFLSICRILFGKGLLLYPSAKSQVSNGESGDNVVGGGAFGDEIAKVSRIFSGLIMVIWFSKERSSPSLG